MDVRAIFGTNMRRYRLAAELSQEELAARMGVEQYYISGLEAGRRNPTLETVARVAEALGVKVGQLFEERPHVRKPQTGTRRKSS